MPGSLHLSRGVKTRSLARSPRSAVRRFFLACLTTKNSRTLSDARDVSTCAFQGVKDTLHPPVAGKNLRLTSWARQPAPAFRTHPCGCSEHGCRHVSRGSMAARSRSGLRTSSVDAALQQHPPGPRIGPVPAFGREITCRKGVTHKSRGDGCVRIRDS